jgi:hypothetical protein
MQVLCEVAKIEVHGSRARALAPCFHFHPWFANALALFCWSGFGWFQLVSAYSLSQNTIQPAETSRLFYQPNQPFVVGLRCLLEEDGKTVSNDRIWTPRLPRERHPL